MAKIVIECNVKECKNYNRAKPNGRYCQKGIFSPFMCKTWKRENEDKYPELIVEKDNKAVNDIA